MGDPKPCVDAFRLEGYTDNEKRRATNQNPKTETRGKKFYPRYVHVNDYQKQTHNLSQSVPDFAVGEPCGSSHLDSSCYLQNSPNAAKTYSEICHVCVVDDWMIRHDASTVEKPHVVAALRYRMLWATVGMLDGQEVAAEGVTAGMFRPVAGMH